ncbi:MAG TPA: peptide ABC transporter substrate-binding protein, partial [Candidatus Tyrphobacter sp.]
VIVQQREPRALNPELENGTSSMEWGQLLFSYLVTWNDKGQLVGDVATEVPTYANGGISKDGRAITYRLRRGVRFSDGKPLTAADCVYTIRAILDPSNNVQSRYGYDRIASATAPNPSTLVLKLRQPFAPLVSLVLAAQDFPILPKHVLAAYSNFNDILFDSKPLGSGPFVVRRWLRGDRVEMDANPLYFRGRPGIAHLTIRFVADGNTAINQLRTGEADGFFDDLDTNNYPTLRSVPGMRVTLTPLNEVGSLIFNTQDPITGDVRVRQALAQAIDMQALVNKAYRGAEQPHDAGRGLFQWAYDERAYPDVRYDPAHARRLLDAAGWILGPDGIRRKNGVPLRPLLIFQAAVIGDEVFSAAVRQYELAIGADVSLKDFDVDTFVAPPEEGGPVYSGKFQMALYPFENGNDPDVIDQFACSHVPPNGYNKSRFCDRRVDALMLAALRTYDPAKRKAIYVQLERILAQQLPIELIYRTREIDAFTTRLRGESVSPTGPFWNAWSWHLAPS